ncbi:potassium-transporting ATPase subunit C [Escherichia coli]
MRSGVRYYHASLRPALSTFIFLLLITGGVYPLLTTALGRWWFPWQTNGSFDP